MAINECHSRLEARGWKFDQALLLAVLKKLCAKDRLENGGQQLGARQAPGADG